MSDQGRSGDQADILFVEDNPGDIRLTEEAFKEGQIDNPLHVVTDGIEAFWHSIVRFPPCERK